MGSIDTAVIFKKISLQSYISMDNSSLQNIFFSLIAKQADPSGVEIYCLFAVDLSKKEFYLTGHPDDIQTTNGINV